jgi:hypothetical protein
MKPHELLVSIKPEKQNTQQAYEINMSVNILSSRPYTGLDRLLGIQEVEAPRISRQSTHEGVKAVSPNHRPPLPQDTFLALFLLKPSRS